MPDPNSNNPADREYHSIWNVYKWFKENTNNKLPRSLLAYCYLFEWKWYLVYEYRVTQASWHSSNLGVTFYTTKNVLYQLEEDRNPSPFSTVESVKIGEFVAESVNDLDESELSIFGLVNSTWPVYKIFPNNGRLDFREALDEYKQTNFYNSKVQKKVNWDEVKSMG